MADNKTQANDGDVEAFIAHIADDEKRADTERLVRLMQRVSRQPPRMWGDSIIGFGHYHYAYASGREGDWFVLGIAPRKRNLSLHVMSGFDMHEEALVRLGKHKRGSGCLYINRLEDIDLKVLEGILRAGYKHVRTHMHRPKT